MDEKTPPRGIGSWIALGASALFASYGVHYAFATARQYGFLPAPLPTPRPAVTLAAPPAPATISPSAPANPPPAAPSLSIPTDPNAPEPDPASLPVGRNVTLRTIPAGPGMQVLVQIYKKPDGQISRSRSLVPTTPPLTPQDLPKLDLAKIREQPSLRSHLTTATLQRVLQTYQQLNKPDSPGYQPGLTAIELFTYHASNEDTQGECWAQTAAFHAAIARSQGSRDILVLAINAAFHLYIDDVFDGYTSREYLNEVLGLQTSPYPALVKLRPILPALKYLSHFSENYADPALNPDDERRYIPLLLDAGIARLEELAREGTSAIPLYFYANALLDKTTSDSGRRQISMDRGQVAVLIPPTPPPGAQPFQGAKRSLYEPKVADALQRAQAPAEVETLLRVEYLCAQAEEVGGPTETGSPAPGSQAIFEARLNEAKQLLDQACVQYPKFVYFPITEMRMIPDQTRREAWYQTALAIDPAYLPTYLNKMDTLQPTSYGSPQQVFDYGMQCLHSGQWDIGLPLVFIKGMETLSDTIPDLYRGNPHVRDMVDSTYREYLRLHPTSLSTRTSYLLFALAAKDWPTAHIQLEHLGNYWDMTQISPWRYSEIIDEVATHPAH